MNITVLGEAKFSSPIRRTVNDAARIPANSVLFLHERFIHVPIELLTKDKKRLDPDGPGWAAVLAATGPPPRFE